MEYLQKQSTTGKTYAMFVALIAWASIIFQFYITSFSAIYYFSFFTTLCNLLIAVSLTFSALSPSSKPGIFFSKLSVQSAIALYIFIVSVVYNSVLRGIMVLTGWGYFLDNMVHVVNPILYILYWLLFRTKGTLQWRDGITWITFPLAYLIYSLIRGAIINWYPYPFLDALKLGYTSVFLNIGLMLAVFFVAGLIFIFITRQLKRSQ